MRHATSTAAVAMQISSIKGLSALALTASLYSHHRFFILAKTLSVLAVIVSFGHQQHTTEYQQQVSQCRCKREADAHGENRMKH